MFLFKEKKHDEKGLQIWPLVGFLYTPIILSVLLINLPKVQWKYVFESNKTKLARHYEKAKNYGYPGIPHHANSGTSKVIYVSKEDIAYGECGWNFYCVPEDLNTTKSINYMKVNPPIKRVKNNVVLFGNTYFCNSFNINSPGKCTSGGWRSGSER